MFPVGFSPPALSLAAINSILAGNAFSGGAFTSSGEIVSTLGGGSATAIAGLGLAATGSTAGNFLTIGVQKTGNDEFYFGINKNSTTNTNIPSNACFITSYLNSSNITIGRGNSAGQPNLADIFIASAGSVGVGAQNITTSSTDGFLMFPAAAGAPTGVPTGQTGRVAMYYDTTNNKIWFYNGSWRGVVVA